MTCLPSSWKTRNRISYSVKFSTSPWKTKLELGETTSEFRTVQNLYDSFISKGNSEDFYATFYGEIALNSSKYFKGLFQRAATLFATKLADTLLGHAKDVTTVSLSENELAGMQYLGGYVLESLHRKHRTSKHKATTES